MSGTVRTLVSRTALLALAALVTACGSDGPSAPQLTAEARAYAMLDAQAAAKDVRSKPLTSALSALALGAPVQQTTVTIGGVAEQFSTVVLTYKKVSGAPSDPDSIIIAVGWRGSNASEMFQVNAASWPRWSGYPGGYVAHFAGGAIDTIRAPVSEPITSGSVQPSSGTCSPLAVADTSSQLALYLQTEVSCAPATVALHAAPTLNGPAGDVTFALDATTLRAARLEVAFP